ncbi:MAG: Hsp20/alpha crystallin family protein [Bryobacteraceae bacterium]
MSLIHYDPFSSIKAFEDVVSSLLNQPQTARPWSPAVDIAETEEALVLKADLPDVKLEDIEVRVENEALTLKGERRFEKEEKSKGYHRIERSFGTFMRTFAVPPSVEADKVSADYRNGVLTVTLPKKEAAKPRQVKVQVKG